MQCDDLVYMIHMGCRQKELDASYLYVGLFICLVKQNWKFTFVFKQFWRKYLSFSLQQSRKAQQQNLLSIASLCSAKLEIDDISRKKRKKDIRNLHPSKDNSTGQWMAAILAIIHHNRRV